MNKGDARALADGKLGAQQLARARELAAQVTQAQAADLAEVLESACDLVDAAAMTPELRGFVGVAVARMERYIAEHGGVSEGAAWTERMRATLRLVKRLRQAERLNTLDEGVFEWTEPEGIHHDR